MQKTKLEKAVGREKTLGKRDKNKTKKKTSDTCMTIKENYDKTYKESHTAAAG